MTWIREEYKFSIWERLFSNILRSGKIPEHVAFIMDGNRRFAKNNKIEKIKGHSQGFERVADTLQWCRHLGITTVTLYAFSIENFKRDPEEIRSLFELFREKIKVLISEEAKLKQHGVRVRIIGNLALLPEDMQELIAEVHRITENNSGSTLNVCFSYTSRDEMTHAVREAVALVERKQIQREDIDEQLIESLLYTSAKVDLLVRTSGECRFSDFLLWQASSSITYFAEILWPEFDFWHLLLAVFYYQRNFYMLKSLTERPSGCRLDASALVDTEKRFSDTVEKMNAEVET